jgi:hypothetical protein
MNIRRFFFVFACLPLFACAAEPPAEEEEVAEAEDALISNPPGEAAKAPMLPADYQSRTAKEKQALVWNLVASSEYRGRLPSGGAGYMLQGIKSFFSLNKTFDRQNDELPQGRHKIFHPFGSVATAEVTYSYPPSAPQYTGMFASTGTPIATIIRLAPAGGKSFTPGIAVKYFVDGQPSVNTQAIESVDGQGDDLDWWHATPTNVTPPPRGFAFMLGQSLLTVVKRDPGHLQLDHLGAVSPDGTRPTSPHTPYQIEYRPHADVGERFGNAAREDFRVVLRRIPAGTVIYDIHARPYEGAPMTKIGELKTTSPLVASANGDYQLFFQHFRGTN